MDRLWSPWRSAHVSTWSDRDESDRGGVFERIADSDDDERDLVIWRGTSVFVVMNRYPYNNGHLLVVPYRRVPSFTDLTAAERGDLAEAVAACQQWLRAAIAPDGFNIGINEGGAGGAAIPQHVHVHVVPRWSGDTSFMASTADVRVIPQAMRETYEKLRAVVALT